MTLSPALLQALVRAAAQTRPDEIGCGACYDQLDAFAEAHLAGRDAAASLPLVARHLEMCPECYDEFEALLEGLRALYAPPKRARLGLVR